MTPTEGSNHVLILSDDALLRELVAELLMQERFSVADASDLTSAAQCCREKGPVVVLVDAIVDGGLAEPLLADLPSVIGDAAPSVVVLTGAGTPDTVREHAYVDAVLPPPLRSEVLVAVVRHHATWRPRRKMQSGTRLRPELVDELRASRLRKAD